MHCIEIFETSQRFEWTLNPSLGDLAKDLWCKEKLDDLFIEQEVIVVRVEIK